ncbi:MAG: alpha-amylase family protein [Myxococcota bacterium]
MWAFMMVTLGPCTPSPERETRSDVVVHLFEWPFADVARECTSVLGPAGVGGVQVSPPQEHILLESAPWWERYQPVSYLLEGRLGSRRDFAHMVRQCRRAGVDVVVDVVLNHTTALPEGEGSAGTPFERYHIPGVYEDADFHGCRRPIHDWLSRHEMWNCELFGLPDLATETAPVRERLAGHLTDLWALGVRGLRVDSAKHMPPDDLRAILGRVDGTFDDPLLEVIDGGAIAASEYYGIGRVTDFAFGMQVSHAVRRGDLASLRTLGRDLLPPDRSFVFVDNHDTQRHTGSERPLTFVDGGRHTLAVAFMLAFSPSKPRLMSSYTFANRDAGVPVDARGRNAAALDGLGQCRAPYVCEHRQPAVRGLVDFRAWVGDAPVTHWWSEGRERIAFSRGDRGFVAFNADPLRPWTARIPTGLPAGRYCDVASSRDECREIDVDEAGLASVDVAPYRVLALHRGAPAR